MQRSAISSVLAQLGAAYRADVSDEQRVVFGETLGRYSDDAVQQAAREWIASQRWFPTPSQLLETTQAVLRRLAREQADERGISESHDRPLPFERRNELAKVGVAECRAALAQASKNRKREPEQGDSE